MEQLEARKPVQSKEKGSASGKNPEPGRKDVAPLSQRWRPRGFLSAERFSFLEQTVQAD